MCIEEVYRIVCVVACISVSYYIRRQCIELSVFLFFQAEDGIRYLVRSRGLGDVYKRQTYCIIM